jgi:hypothetical protein
MPQLEPFIWEKSTGFLFCKWKGIHLAVSDGTVLDAGIWQVYRLPAVWNDPNRIDWQMQVSGNDLQDAQRRAQAAAMVLHQLSEQEHGQRTEENGAPAPQGEAQS